MDTEDILTASYVIDKKKYDATNGIVGIGKKGAIMIKITDYSNSKISGTFKFTAVGDDNSEITITEGLFEKIPAL